MIHTFDAEKHHHYLDGKRAVGVTTVLKQEGYINFPAYLNLEEQIYRGNYVHAACHLLNIGKLDYAGLLPQFKGYVDGYKRWIADTQAQCACSEAHVFSPVWRYCGILDSVQVIEGQGWVVDIKTGGKESISWPLQTAAYKLAYETCPDIIAKALPPVKYRMILQLKEDGSYKPYPYKDKRDEREWLTIIASYTQKVAKKIIKLGDDNNE